MNIQQTILDLCSENPSIFTRLRFTIIFFPRYPNNEKNQLKIINQQKGNIIIIYFISTRPIFFFHFFAWESEVSFKFFLRSGLFPHFFCCSFLSFLLLQSLFIRLSWTYSVLPTPFFILWPFFSWLLISFTKYLLIIFSTFLNLLTNPRKSNMF